MRKKIRQDVRKIMGAEHVGIWGHYKYWKNLNKEVTLLNAHLAETL